MSTATRRAKGKGSIVEARHSRIAPPGSQSRISSDSNSDSSSDSPSDSSDSSASSSDTDDEISQEFLDSLLDRARRNAALEFQTLPCDESGADDEEEVIQLDSAPQPQNRPLPPLNPGALLTPYIELSDTRQAGPSRIRDLDIEQAEQAASSHAIPAAPPAPPELTKSGKPPTKKEKKALKNRTAGPGWFDLPAPAEADIPRLYREYEALRLRNQLDPKRFYKKDEGEGKGIRGLPKHFAIGTIMATESPFGGPSAENLSKANRKRTLVDELVDDAEARSYAKKKFKELQTVRTAKGRGTLAKKKALRKPKW